jgi:GNAT superfamily N-acetyltransferase
MNSITRATTNETGILANIGRQTFYESHGHSAPKKDTDIYAQEKFSEEAIQKELENPGYIYHILYIDEKAAAFTKIVLDSPLDGHVLTPLTKLDRIYVLQSHYQQGLGQQLLDFNIDYSKKHNQKGMWLCTWIENKRAINFYNRNHFKIVGSYDFHVSPTHINPNHIMLLTYE